MLASLAVGKAVEPGLYHQGVLGEGKLMAVHGTEGGIEPGVHGVGSLIQHATTMVGDGLELELEAVGGAEVKGLGGAEPEDEGLLMLVAPEDEALPVDPGVESGTLSFVANLQAHLGVCGEVELRIVERLMSRCFTPPCRCPRRIAQPAAGCIDAWK